MFLGKEAKYYLLDVIDNIKAIAPKNEPLVIDPVNHLDNQIRNEDLALIFRRLAEDEKVIKLIQVPQRVKSVVDDLDPYDKADDGCWHIELKPTFDRYYLEIRQEPKYKQFTGTDTDIKINPSLSYEEKLEIILKAIVEAQKTTRKEYRTKLYIKEENKLETIEAQSVNDILLQLQDDEKILKVSDKPSSIKTFSEKPPTELIDIKDYFLIEILDTFEDWYENYLMKQKTELKNLDYINMLRVYDVVLDINEQIQLTNKTTVHIKLLPSLIRFNVLFPGDTINVRDEYCRHRLDGLKYLKRKGIISNYEHNKDGWNTIVTVTFKLSPFDEFCERIKNEYRKQNEPEKKDMKPENINLKEEPRKEKVKVSYNSRNGQLDINGKTVKFKRESFRAKLLELLLKDDESRQKEWSWDEVIEEIEEVSDSYTIEQNKNKFYSACDGLSKHIALKTGTNDLLIFNKSTVQINPKYLQ